jgi:hypothetical protein
MCTLRELLGLILDRSHMCKGHMLKALLNCYSCTMECTNPDEGFSEFPVLTLPPLLYITDSFACLICKVMR